MTATSSPFVRLNPSRVEGVPDVSEVVVRPDRLELLSAGQCIQDAAGTVEGSRSQKVSFLSLVVEARIKQVLVNTERSVRLRFPRIHLA